MPSVADLLRLSSTGASACIHLVRSESRVRLRDAVELLRSCTVTCRPPTHHVLGSVRPAIEERGPTSHDNKQVVALIAEQNMIPHVDFELLVASILHQLLSCDERSCRLWLFMNFVVDRFRVSREERLRGHRSLRQESPVANEESKSDREGELFEVRDRELLLASPSSTVMVLSFVATCFASLSIVVTGDSGAPAPSTLVDGVVCDKPRTLPTFSVDPDRS